MREREGIDVYLKVRAPVPDMLKCDYFTNGCQNAGALVVEVE